MYILQPPRIGKSIGLVMLLGAAVALGGCNNSGKSARSVADFIHDIDSARALLKDAKLHPERSADADVINASKAVAEAMAPTMLECWPTKPSSTATTDHACLDRKGFTR